MKLTIFLLIALFAIAHAEPSCSDSSYCMGCDLTTADKCTACYNGVVTTIEPRYLNSNNCSSKINKITDCAIYNPENATQTAITNSLVGPDNKPSCWACATGKTLTFSAAVGEDDLSAANLLQGDMSGELHCIVPVDANAEYTSAKTGAVTGCTHSIFAACTKPGDTNGDGSGTVYASKSTNMCLVTGKDTCFKDDVQTAPSAAGCDDYANCESTILKWTNAAVAATAECFNPKPEYAVKADKASAVSFTNDANCRRLHTDATNCALCKDTYWFHGAKCYMRSGLIFLSAVAFFVAWFF